MGFRLVAFLQGEIGVPDQPHAAGHHNIPWYSNACIACALVVLDNLMLQVEVEEARHAEAEKHSAAESALQTRLGDAQSVIGQLQSTTTRLQVMPAHPSGRLRGAYMPSIPKKVIVCIYMNIV